MNKSNLTKEQKLLNRLGTEKLKLLGEYLEIKRMACHKQLETERDEIDIRQYQGQIKNIKGILRDIETIKL